MPTPEVSCLFVYGTLMPQRLRWPFLAPFAVGHRPAIVPGAIFDSGRGWPVAVFTDADALAPGGMAPGSMVPGVLVDLDPLRLDEALAILDGVEGTATDTLRRIVVSTTDGATAWAYHCSKPVDGMSQIESWHDSFVER